MFEINIVANSFCGFFNKSTTAFCLSESDSKTSDSVALDSEKKATSAPEIKADRISNKNNIAKLISSKILKLSAG